MSEIRREKKKKISGPKLRLQEPADLITNSEEVCKPRKHAWNSSKCHQDAATGKDLSLQKTVGGLGTEKEKSQAMPGPSECKAAEQK